MISVVEFHISAPLHKTQYWPKRHHAFNQVEIIKEKQVTLKKCGTGVTASTWASYYMEETHEDPLPRSILYVLCLRMSQNEEVERIKVLII